MRNTVAIAVATSSAAGGGVDPKASVAGGAGLTATQGGGVDPAAGGAGPTATQDGGAAPAATHDVAMSDESKAMQSGPASKRQRICEGMIEFTNPWKFNVNYSSTEVTLHSRDSGNKRLPKYFAFGTWNGGNMTPVDSFAKLRSDQLPYELLGSDLVFDLESATMMRLDKVAEANPIYGFKGTGKQLALGTQKFAVTMETEGVLFFKAAKKSSFLVATFAFKFDPERKCQCPHYAGVYLKKQLTVEGCEKFVLWSAEA